MDFPNQAVAIDASSWFHKSVYSIADHYVECIEKHKNFASNGGGGGGGGNPTSTKLDAKCIAVSRDYMIKRCEQLLSDPQRGRPGVSKIYLVMDGERCPLKAVTNQERIDKRTKALELARKYKAQGQTEKMHEQYRSCIKVVNALSYTVAVQVQAYFVAAASSSRNSPAAPPRVEIVWSPYEADAQLVQLCGLERKCAAVVTEDSDVLVYCAAGNISIPIIYKLDRHNGNCSILSMDWLVHPHRAANHRINNNNNINNSNAAAAATFVPAVPQQPAKVSTIDAIFDTFVGRQIQQPGWGTRLFVQACVLAGCDYSPRGQIPGVGFVNAFKYVQMAGLSPRNEQLDTLFDRILTIFLPLKSRRLILNAIPILETQLSQSEAVFFYHPVLKPQNSVEYLTEPCPVTNATTYQPSLHRYQNDLSFLGSLTMNRTMGDSGIIPKNAWQQNCHHRHKRKSTDTRSSEHPTARPTKSIFVPFRCSTNTNHPVFPDDVSPLSSSPSSGIAIQNENVVPPTLKQSAAAAAVSNRPARPVINPYDRPPKKNEQSRRPLQSLTNTDPLDDYARRHREIGILGVNRIVTAQLPVRSHKNTTMNHPARGNPHQDMCHGPPIIAKQTVSSVICKDNTVDEVRFVKRTDYGIDIDVEQHIYRPPPIRRNECSAKQTTTVPFACTTQHVRNRREQQQNILAVDVSNDLTESPLQLKCPIRSPKPIVKSKFFSSQRETNTLKQQGLFAINEECPPLPQPNLDVVSLIDFDRYESQCLLSPDMIQKRFDYEAPNESPGDEKSLIGLDVAPILHHQLPHVDCTTERTDRPMPSFAQRRVTLELPTEERVENMRPTKILSSHRSIPMRFNLYDTCQSPIDDIITIDESVDECIASNTQQNVSGIANGTRRLGKTLSFRVGPEKSVKPPEKKLVKRPNIIQRVLHKHSTRRPLNRVPVQSTILSHFQPEQRSVR